MNDAPKSERKSAAAPSRWGFVVAASDGEGREALRDLAGSYWYGVYAWWRRTGLEEKDAAATTVASFTRWLGESPPSAEDSGAERMRAWLPARLAELAARGVVEMDGPPALAIDPAWAERRFADEPGGEPDAIFQRRWALTVLEFAASTLQSEYAARGEEALLAELLPFAGFEPADDARYAAAGARVGRSSGAMHKAVFDFRTRQREVLRGIIADTVADPAETDSEITTLLCAIDIPGATDANTPLPSAIRSLRPDEVLARAMRSVRMTGAGQGGWKPPSDAEIARLFPEYEILGLIGRGGMGAVYKARQLELDRVVAVKLLPLEVSADRDFADRFRREARAMAKMSHPHIITVYDFGTTSEGHLFFVMEFVEGANLDDMIRKVGIEPAQALVLAAQVCTALAYAHEKGIVHRDIKPANVMVDLAGQAKVADFGLARVGDAATEEPGHTVTGTVMGTPDYMAPEQKHGMHVDHRADIYSVGVMLYEMLCRETPQGAFEPPSKRIGCDTRIDRIVLKAMQQAPDRRYQTTHEMRADVATALTPPAPTPKRRLPTVPLQPPAETPQRGAPILTLATLLVLGVLGFLIYEKMKPQPVAVASSGVTTPAPTAAPATPQPEEPKPALSGSPAPKPAKAALAAAPATPAPTTPIPTPAAPKSATGKWLAEQEPVWQAAYAAEVGVPFMNGVGNLKKQYLAALDTQLAAFAKAAKLDDAVAFRAERERLAGSGDVPAEDEATTPASLKTLRASYRTAFTKLDTERFTKAKIVHARYDTLLTQSQAALTQKQRLDEALEMKAKREALSAAWLTPPGGVAPVSPPLNEERAAKPVEPALNAIPVILKEGFTNSLGMKFVKVPGTEVLFCVHETRRQDYAAYAQEVHGVNGAWQNQQSRGVPIGGDNIHPVVAVSWDDAQAFCAWLSKKEGKTYRLPTDEEWSFAVGLGYKEKRKKDTTPDMLQEKEKDYPWDGPFPPKPKDRAGNYSDSAYHEKFPGERWNEWHNDGFPTTAPVMSFKPNKYGLYDLGGNVREWVDDWFTVAQQERTIRGSFWGESGPSGYFLSSHRYHYSASTRSSFIGFRAVVESRLPAKPAAVIAKATPAPANKPAPAKETDGWEDLLSKLTPAEIGKTGWRLQDGEFFNPQASRSMLPIPGTLSGTSYQVRLKLRQITPKDRFYLALPVAGQMVGFVLDSGPDYLTGLTQVDGKTVKSVSGFVEGRQVKDSEPHLLEVTVRLDGANATITAALDTRPLYAWTGPTAALSQHNSWKNEPGRLALAVTSDDWAVSEVKLKRLDAASALSRPAPAVPPTAAVPKIAIPVNPFGPWRPLFTEAEWKESKSRKQIVDGRMNLQGGQQLMKPLPAADGAIRARIRLPETGKYAAVNARALEGSGVYKLQVTQQGSAVVLEYYPSGGKGIELGRKYLSKPFQPGDTLLLELRLQGDHLTALTDGAVVIEAQDSRRTGPGEWGIIANDGWFESVEVQTPPPATPAPAPPPGPDGWQDLLARLTPAGIEKTGNGWSLKGGALFSPNTKFAALPLPGDLSGTSYQVRVKIRRIAGSESFNLFLPIGDRMVGAALDGWPGEGNYSGLQKVNGADPRTLPGSVRGQQVKDSEPHDFQVTVRLTGADATITTTLDTRPLYEWTGPTAALSLSSSWSIIEPGTLALGTMAAEWVVSEVKVKRLDARK